MENLSLDQEISKLSRALYVRWLGIFYELGSDTLENREKFLEIIFQRVLGLMKENEDSFVILKNDINSKIDLHAVVFKKEIEKIAILISKKILELYSVEELESKFYSFNLQNGYLPLNKMFTYGVDKNEITLHMPTTFVSSMVEIKEMFFDALLALIDKRKKNKINNFQKISLKSYLVFKNKKLLEKFGFILVEEDFSKKIAKMEVSFDDLERNIKNLILKKEALKEWL